MKNFHQDLIALSELCFFVWVASLGLWLSPVSAETPSFSRPRAERIHNQHLRNFHKVSDNFYRSAQPSAPGFKELERLGIRTIINLRSRRSDKAALNNTNLRYEEIKMVAAFPDEQQVLKFLRVVSNKENGPFLVHCHYGSDRTGTMAAIYRIFLQGWSKDEAIAEMTGKQFGFNSIWRLTLVRFLRNMNVDELRRKAGLNYQSANSTPGANLNQNQYGQRFCRLIQNH